MNMTHLFPTNASVDAHNDVLSKADKAQIQEAVDIIVGDISDELKKQIKIKIPDDPSKTMSLYSLVSLVSLVLRCFRICMQTSSTSVFRHK